MAEITTTLDTSSSVQQMLDACAAKQPTPGGGAVAALSGALACTMVEMAIRYSIGRRGSEAYREELEVALSEVTKARSIFEQLIVEDQLAFGALTAARKGAAGSDAAQSADAALVAAIRVPETISGTALAVLDVADRIVDIANPWLLSDLAVAGDLAMATVRCGLYNVDANLGDLKDPNDRQMILRECESMLQRGVGRVAVLSAKIAARLKTQRAQNSSQAK